MNVNQIAATDNTVVYELYLTDRFEEKLELYKKHIAEKFGHIHWRVDAFKIEILTQQSDQHLIVGNTKFNEHIEDEWLVIYILYDLSKLDQDLVIRVYDNDGNILLIETAEHLPRWLNSKESDTRAFIHRGNLHILPNIMKLEELDTINGKLTQLQAAANYIRNNCKTNKYKKPPFRTLANSAIQSAIRTQLSGLPERNVWLDKKQRFLEQVITNEKEKVHSDDSDENHGEASGSKPKKRLKCSSTLDEIAAMTEEDLQVSSSSEDDDDEDSDADDYYDLDEDDNLNDLSSDDDDDEDLGEEIKELGDAFKRMYSDNKMIEYMRSMDAELEGTNARE